MPWTIKVVNPPNSTHSQFFESVELSDTDQPRLNQTYVGKAKDRLDIRLSNSLCSPYVGTLYIVCAKRKG